MVFLSCRVHGIISAFCHWCCIYIVLIFWWHKLLIIVVMKFVIVVPGEIFLWYGIKATHTWFVYIEIQKHNHKHICIYPMAVPPNLLPSHSEKTLGAMKAERTVRRITFNPSKAQPGETLYVSVPKLSEHEVLVSGSLALVFNINLTGGHANNYLVQNVSRALVDKPHVKFAATSVHEMAGYDIYKIFEDLFLSEDERANMLSEGIQSVDLCKIRSGSGDKKTTGVDEENKLQSVYSNKYRINLDHPILTDHAVFYPQALYNDLIFKLTLAPASQVV